MLHNLKDLDSWIVIDWLSRDSESWIDGQAVNMEVVLAYLKI
jgi:hypothetical protein